MSRLILLLIIVEAHQVINTPLGVNEKEAHQLKPIPNDIPAILTSNHGQKLPGLVPLVHSPHVAFINKQENARQKKGPTIPLSLPLPHHLLLPTNLHVIPIHHTVHTRFNLITNQHVQLPVSHTYTHSTSNVTHSTPLVPILIPIHTHLVPIHDLTVIPLHASSLHAPLHNAGPKFSRYRTSMDKKDNDEDEPINRFRSFYGGYGNGLYIGGHGAGHGFYAYG